VAPGGCAGPKSHSGCSSGRAGYFGGSHAMKTQRLENSQKSVFGRTLGASIDMKGWFTRVEPMPVLLTSGPTLVRKICAKHLFFLQTNLKYNLVYLNNISPQR
jgi:hypothetical protein